MAGGGGEGTAPVIEYDPPSTGDREGEVIQTGTNMFYWDNEMRLTSEQPIPIFQTGATGEVILDTDPETGKLRPQLNPAMAGKWDGLANNDVNVIDHGMGYEVKPSNWTPDNVGNAWVYRTAEEGMKAGVMDIVLIPDKEALRPKTAWWPDAAANLDPARLIGSACATVAQGHHDAEIIDQIGIKAENVTGWRSEEHTSELQSH